MRARILSFGVITGIFISPSTIFSQQLKSPIAVVASVPSSNGVSPNQMINNVSAEMGQAGIGWARIYAIWAYVESDSSIYDWTHLDSAVNTYANAGMNLFITLVGGNQWYDTLSAYPNPPYENPAFASPPVYSPSYMNQWLNFVSTAVNRYKNKVKHWSIWNEPNLSTYWPPKPDSIGYLNLVKQTSPVIKSIDPSAKIISGNTSMIDFEYLNAIIDSLIPYTDFIGFHPYRRYPDETQDSFIVAGLITQPIASLTSFDEELDSLNNLLRQADPTGKVKLWDEESGFPSLNEPILWEMVHSCDTVQAKNILRKHLLNFAHDVAVSTYWGDFDNNSSVYNVLGEKWVSSFYAMTLNDWKEKEYMFFFFSIGMTYAPAGDSIVLEAENYETISGNLYDAGNYIYYPDSFPIGLDINTAAVYKIPIAQQGNYLVFFHIRNPNPTEVAAVGATFDSINYFLAVTSQADDSLNRFIWTTSFETEPLKIGEWIKGYRIFALNADTVTLTVFPIIGGCEIDKIILQKETVAPVKKLSYYVVSNLAQQWDGRWARDTFLTISATNGNVPASDWNEKRFFAFRDTLTQNSGVVYWLGVSPFNDNYPNYQCDLTINNIDTTNIQSIVMIDFLSGSQTPVSYNLSPSSVSIPNLSISDTPRMLLIQKSTGIAETLFEQEKVWIYPNPSSGKINVAIRSPINIGIKMKNIEIYDVLGQKVFQSIIKNSPSAFHLDLPSGIYFVKLNNGEKQYIQKIIISK